MSDDIDMKSIMKKAEKYMATKTMQGKIWKKTNAYMIYGKKVAYTGADQQKSASKVASEFIKIYKDQVGDAANRGLLGDTAVRAVSNLSKDAPTNVNNKYEVLVHIDGDGHRASLSPDNYPDGVTDIAILLNNGYKARQNVFGVWNGHNNNEPIWSKRYRPGAHFIENTKQNFMNQHGPSYGVEDIVVITDAKSRFDA